MSDKKLTRLKHDELVKSFMGEPLLARDFLEEHAPADFKADLDLTDITIEKETYIEENLRKKSSDIVFKVKTKTGGDAFIYTLLEHQSSKPDYWMAFRLLKYSLLLLERHKDDNKDKLPLICPLVLYHGTTEYNAPRNFWDLFVNPEKAKNLLGGDYKLIDLHEASDDEILKNNKLALFEYCLKHIHRRNKEKLLKDIFAKCKEAIIIDEKRGFISIVRLLRYIDTQIPEERRASVAKLVTTNLIEGEKIMRSIAQAYMDEGRAEGRVEGRAEGRAEGEARGIDLGVKKGIDLGIKKGEVIGIAKGEAKGVMKVAKNLLKQGLSFDAIAKATGLSLAKIRQLQGE